MTDEATSGPGSLGGETGGDGTAGEAGGTGLGGETAAGGVPAQGSDAAADAALSRVAGGGEGEGGGGAARPPGEPTTEGESWRPGGHYLARLAVDMGPITGLDVVADAFDDEYQEAAALAKVRQLIETTVRFEDLEEPLAEALPADEHGAFRGAVTPPEEGRQTAEIRITHEHPEDEGDEGEEPPEAG